MNKKIMFLSLFLLFFAVLRAWECVDCTKKFLYGESFIGTMNSRLPDMMDRLERKHGIFTSIRLDSNKGKYDLFKAAYGSLTETAGRQSEKGILIIYVNLPLNKGVVLISDNLKDRFPDKYIRSLQDDVLNNLQGKWYVERSRLLTKVAGTFVYLLEKDTYTKEDLFRLSDRMIIVDDPVYRMSLLPVVNDLILLFYMEPISFMFYFPFVMYFLIVRWYGMRFGQTGFWVSNICWFGLMAFFAVLILNRIKIYFPEYVLVFLLIGGLNIPLYLMFFSLYRSHITSAAYNYFNEVTGGGFDSANSFGGKKWQ